MVAPSVCLCLDSQTLAGVWTGLSPLWTGRRQPRLSVESEAWECVNVQSNQGPNRLCGGQLTKALKGRTTTIAKGDKDAKFAMVVTLRPVTGFSTSSLRGRQS